MAKETVWETVTRRKNKNVRTATAGNEGTINNRTDNREKMINNRIRRRPQKTVAMAIKGEEGFSYADALKKARTEISSKNRD